MHNGYIIESSLVELMLKYLQQYAQYLNALGDSLSLVQANNIEYILDTLDNNTYKCKYELKYVSDIN